MAQQAMEFDDWEIPGNPHGYMRSGFADVNVFKLDMWRLSKLLDDMAYRDNRRSFFDYLVAAIQEQTSVRDHLNGEKVIQGFLIAYLNVPHSFLTWSEREMDGGFVDLYLELFLGRYPDMKYGISLIPNSKNQILINRWLKRKQKQSSNFANMALTLGSKRSPNK